ncbi:MAG: carbohydrate ABC transporter permease [Ktedonobacteraceae bacterium]|nr:carbohydrate ABC transporter permease [Ktedonobacteraceae bacterium]
MGSGILQQAQVQQERRIQIKRLLWRRRLRKAGWNVPAYVVVLLMTLLSLLPTIYMIDLSLRDPITSFSPVLIAPHPLIDNYRQVLSSPGLYQYFLNSVIVSLSSVALTVFVVLLASFGISRLRIKGAGLIFYVLISGLMIPLASLIVPLTVELKQMSLLNNYFGLIGPFTAIGIPLGLLVVKGAMDNVPADLEEAALIDGATPWQVLWRTIVPVIRPSILVVAIWQFLYSWNEFFLALVVMTDTGMKTVPLLPLVFEGPFMTDPGKLFAILTVISLVPMLVYIALQRWFVGGLMAGSLKG